MKFKRSEPLHRHEYGIPEKQKSQYRIVSLWMIRGELTVPALVVLVTVSARAMSAQWTSPPAWV